jgi:hypothetical protein
VSKRRQRRFMRPFKLSVVKRMAEAQNIQAPAPADMRTGLEGRPCAESMICQRPGPVTWLVLRRHHRLLSAGMPDRTEPQVRIPV